MTATSSRARASSWSVGRRLCRSAAAAAMASGTMPTATNGAGEKRLGVHCDCSAASSEYFRYMKVSSPSDCDTPFLLAHWTSLKRHVPQAPHCDMSTTCAAGQGALSLFVWCPSIQERRDWQVAVSPKIEHSELQPKSGAVLFVVVAGSVDGTAAKGCLVCGALAAVKLVLAADLVDCTAAWGGSGSTVGATDVGSVLVTTSVSVDVMVVVTELASVVVVVSVSVSVSVRVVVAVGVSVAVEVCVVSSVVVGGHPFDSYMQHHAFQSGVHAHSQMSASAWQS